MAYRRNSQSPALNLGLAAAAALVLAIMGTVVGVAVTAVEPGGDGASPEISTPAMWQEPPAR